MKNEALEQFKDINLGDCLVLAGLIGMFYGLYQCQPWMAYTVIGALLTYFGLRMSKAKEK